LQKWTWQNRKRQFDKYCQIREVNLAKQPSPGTPYILKHGNI